MPRGGEKNGRSKLSLDQVKEIRLQYILDRKARTKFATVALLAREYEVGTSTIQGVIQNKTWRMPEAFPSEVI